MKKGDIRKIFHWAILNSNEAIRKKLNEIGIIDINKLSENSEYGNRIHEKLMKHSDGLMQKIEKISKVIERRDKTIYENDKFLFQLTNNPYKVFFIDTIINIENSIYNLNHMQYNYQKYIKTLLILPILGYYVFTLYDKINNKFLARIFAFNVNKDEIFLITNEYYEKEIEKDILYRYLLNYRELEYNTKLINLQIKPTFTYAMFYFEDIKKIMRLFDYSSKDALLLKIYKFITQINIIRNYNYEEKFRMKTMENLYHQIHKNTEVKMYNKEIFHFIRAILRECLFCNLTIFDNLICHSCYREIEHLKYEL